MSSLEFPIKFENPTYGLVGVVLGTVAIALFYLSFKRLRTAQKKLELVEWRTLRRVMRFLNVATKAGVILSLSFLLAVPYFPTTIQVPVDKATDEQLSQYTVATMMLMDVSYSMNNSDLKPTRLEAAKLMAETFLTKIDPRDIVGFLSFANQTYDPVFPTTNRTKITEEIDSQTLRPSTALGNAIEAALGILETAPTEARAIVLFSDGKNNTGIPVTSAIDAAVSMKIPIFTVSMGTYGFQSDPVLLRTMSEKTGGKFYEVRNEDIENLASEVSKISHEVKTAALEGVYDKLTVSVKDYETASIVFSSALVSALFLMWLTGV